MIKFNSGIWIELTEANYELYQPDFISDLKPGSKIYVPNCEITLNDNLAVVSIKTEKEVLIDRDSVEFVSMQLSKL